MARTGLTRDRLDRIFAARYHTRRSRGDKPTALHTTVPVAASGAFNPLHGVLCILRSLYFCAIGPRSVCCLATDTRRSSNCSPKPFYSRIRPATSGRVSVRCQGSYGTCHPTPWFRSRTLLGTEITRSGHGQSLRSPQRLLESNESRSRRTQQPRPRGLLAGGNRREPGATRRGHASCAAVRHESGYANSGGDIDHTSCSFIRHYCSNRGCLLFLH